MTNGTEKQIAWAERIRTEWLELCIEDKITLRAFVPLSLYKDQATTFRQEIMPIITEWAMNQNDAQFWIGERTALSTAIRPFLVVQIEELEKEILARQETPKTDWISYETEKPAEGQIILAAVIGYSAPRVGYFEFDGRREIFICENGDRIRQDDTEGHATAGYVQFWMPCPEPPSWK